MWHPDGKVEEGIFNDDKFIGQLILEDEGIFKNESVE